VSQVPIGMSRRRHALVHLNDVHVTPGHILIGQDTQHRPRSTAATDGDNEATPRGDSGPRLPGGEGSARPRYRIGIGQHFDFHGTVTVGFCQPPSGETLAPTSFGPQVPGSYSWTGVPAFSTGSTIRHASST